MTARTEPETCEDCADLIERERGDLPGLEGAALHLAVGALYGGSCCDHVDWDFEDASLAFEALWAQRGRERDRLRAEVERLLNKWSDADALWITAKAEVERLREALKLIAEADVSLFSGEPQQPSGRFCVLAARRALASDDGGAA